MLVSMVSDLSMVGYFASKSQALSPNPIDHIVNSTPNRLRSDIVQSDSDIHMLDSFFQELKKRQPESVNIEDVVNQLVKEYKPFRFSFLGKLFRFQTSQKENTSKQEMKEAITKLCNILEEVVPSAKDSTQTEEELQRVGTSLVLIAAMAIIAFMGTHSADASNHK